jgi:hypothetical protein
MSSKMSDGFDFPVGKPDAQGYYNAQSFLDKSYKNIPHLGDDWNGTGGGNTDLGDPVFAVSNGEVVYCNSARGWGNVVIIRHQIPDTSEMESLYAHLDQVDVALNQIITKGNKIGTIGTGGGLYKAHLHFEIRNSDCASWGKPGVGYSTNHSGWVNPTQYINDNRKFHGFAAQYHSQADYPVLKQGDSGEWWIKFKNTGVETWENHNQNNRITKIALGTYSHPDSNEGVEFNSDWPGKHRLSILEEKSVEPGQIGLFKFKLQAPFDKPPGEYKIQLTPKTPAGWLKQSDGGALNCFVIVTVQSAEIVDSDSEFLPESFLGNNPYFSNSSTCTQYSSITPESWSTLQTKVTLRDDPIYQFKKDLESSKKECYHIRIKLIDEYKMDSNRHLKDLNGLNYQLTFFSDAELKTVKQGQMKNNMIAECDILRQNKVQISIGLFSNTENNDSSTCLMLNESIDADKVIAEKVLIQPDPLYFNVSTSYTYEIEISLLPYQAIILYPSMGCPLVCYQNEPLSLLIASKHHIPPNPLQVNRQLNILNWARNKKKCSKKLLYESVESTINYITIEKVECSSNNTVDCSNDDSERIGLKKAIIYNQIKQSLDQNDYSHYYQITLKPDNNSDGLSNVNDYCQKTGVFHIAWMNPPDVEHEECYEDTMDQILIKKNLINEHGPKIYKNGTYLPKVSSSGSGTYRISFMDQSCPLQIFHPVFIIKKNDYVNIAHMSDLHIVNRHCIINKSGARVINGNRESKSSTVGSMVNVAFNSVQDLMNTVGNSDDIDVLIITGDLIDYVRDYYPEDHILDTRSGEKDILKVRSECDLSGDVTADNSSYQMYSSYLTFLSLLHNFYMKYKKPVFIVTGNHEVYRDPFGISPRIGFGMFRANEGIPADHNLTIYEAILAFGDSYDTVVTKFNFKSELFVWYYTLVCPFTDYIYEFLNQVLIGLGWGQSEEMISYDQIPAKIPLSPKYYVYKNTIDCDAQGVTHLPRANESISDKQKDLIEYVIENDKKTGKVKKRILFSHFTYASYNTNIADRGGLEGDIEYDMFQDYSNYDMGTFQVNRKKVYESYIQSNHINIFLSGHSHRRGLYQFQRICKWGDNSIKVKSYHFPCALSICQKNDNKIACRFSCKMPVFVVSDSAGSIPKKNYNNEFYSQGATKPSVSIVKFNSDGTYFDVFAVETGLSSAKPRFAVSLDYLDIIEKHKTVFQQFDGFLIDRKPDEIRFSVCLIDQKVSFLESISIHKSVYGYWLTISNRIILPGDKDEGIFLVGSQESNYVEINRETGKQTVFTNFELFKFIVATDTHKELYMKIKFIKREYDPFGGKIENFEEQYGHYDYDSEWCFPIRVSSWKDYYFTIGWARKYFIKRIAAEKPSKKRLEQNS